MKSDWKETERQAEQRRLMVERQIRARGVRDERILEAMLRIPRHLFVPPALRPRAYEDSPLPTAEGQTISQPYIVAWMTDLLGLKGDEVVLEVGTGSGYQAAILALLAGKVYTIERIPALAESARTILSEFGLDNVEVIVGDGTRGLPEHAPYKGIIVTAGGPRVPDVLVEQLDEGGRLVIPVGPSSLQMLTVVEKRGGRIFTEQKGSCVFVPLIGQHGWE
ncbi:MAG: protein-L-isoaspartate(D-aspartate) O-methyltransferase [Actinomycetota bacterium]